MTAVEFTSRARVQYSAQAGCKLRSCVFNVGAQTGAQPGRKRRSESLLPSPTNLRRNPIRQTSAKQRLSLASAKVILHWQGGGECEKIAIQKRGSALQCAAHAGSIHLDQDLFRQVSVGGVFHRGKRKLQAGMAESGVPKFL